jgi:hypothetical protein
MWCSTCQSVVPTHDERAGESRCPDCGGALRPMTTTADAAVTSESLAQQAWHGGALDDEAPAEHVEQIERALVVRRQPEAPVTMFERVTALPALAWRQPVVRSVVKTGAGAVALALVTRAARRWLAGPQRGRGAGERLLPAIADALGSPQNGPRPRRERGSDEGALVVETFIYARRVIHR